MRLEFWKAGLVFFFEELEAIMFFVSVLAGRHGQASTQWTGPFPSSAYLPTVQTDRKPVRRIYTKCTSSTNGKTQGDLSLTKNLDMDDLLKHAGTKQEGLVVKIQRSCCGNIKQFCCSLYIIQRCQLYFQAITWRKHQAFTCLSGNIKYYSK